MSGDDTHCWAMPLLTLHSQHAALHQALSDGIRRLLVRPPDRTTLNDDEVLRGKRPRPDHAAPAGARGV